MAAFQTAACNIKHRLQGHIWQMISDTLIKIREYKSKTFDRSKYFLDIVRYL